VLNANQIERRNVMSIYESKFWLKNYDWKTDTTLRYPKFPAYSLLRNASTYQPNKAATWFYGAEITFNELYQKCTRLANVLVENGVKKGDRVGILLPNCPQFVIAYWAINMAGGIIVNINPLYTKEELKFIFDDTHPAALVTYDAMLPLVRPLNKEAENPIATVYVSKLSDFMAGTPISTAADLGLEEGYLHFCEVLQTDKTWAPPLVDIKPDDPMVIQYTGGTTGFPKGALLSNTNIVAGSIGIWRWCSDYVESQSYDRRRVLSIIPFCHIYGETACIGYSTVHVATMVILPRFDPEEVFNILHNFENISYWPAVPTMLQALFYSPRVNEIDWHGKIGYCGSGAAPASIELIKKCRDYDFNFAEGWGMSETCATGLGSPGQGNHKPLSVGIPMIDYTVKIMGEDGKEVPLGERGEIWIKGPTVMKEYWNRPEDSKNAFSEDGYLMTGDVAYMDEDGVVFIVDRTKDMIIAGGYNIYPQDVDSALLRNPKVADAMTIGIPDEYRGETVKSFVVLVPGQTATAEELTVWCRDLLAAYKVPRIIEFRTELPRTNTGKALRRILKEEEMAK